jgi:DNA-binding response OmpR family regulator
MRTTYRALIVDDNQPIQRLSALALQQNGFECECTSDGLHASELVRQSKFDVVVTELRIPGKHGHALTLELLEQEPRPLIVIHTGFKEPRLVKDLLLRGVDDIVFKPIDFAILAAKVYGLVQRRLNGTISQSQEQQRPDVGELGRVTFPQLNARLSQVSQLLTMSGAALEVFQLTRRLDRSVSEIASAIGRDASIASDVLCLANSSLHNNTGQQISDLEQAVVLIGNKRIGEIALAAHAASSMASQALPWMNVQLESKRAMAAGMIVDYLVKLGAHAEIDHGLSLCASLHYLGRMALGLLFPEHYEVMLSECTKNGESLDEQERRIFPVNHTEVAGALLASWRISPDEFLPLKFSLDDFSSLARLAEPLRTKAELVKVAVLLGRLTIGHWEEWEPVQLLPLSVPRRLGVKQAHELVRQTRQDLDKSSKDRGTLKKSTNETGPKRRISYCDLTGADSDLLAELLREIGITLHECQLDEAQQLETPLIANCIGPVSAQAVMKLRPATTLIVTDADKADLFLRFSHTTVLPASSSTFKDSVLRVIEGVERRPELSQ